MVLVTKDKLFLVKSIDEFVPKDRISELPNDSRGIYVLLDKRKTEAGKDVFDVVYVGMSKWNIRHRLSTHARSKRKSDLWSHFSVFQVNENIPSSVVTEMEGLLRRIYRKDSNANRINKYKGFKKFFSLTHTLPISAS